MGGAFSSCSYELDASVQLGEIIKDLKDGEIICLADNENIENEIDMMCLAVHATTENINYMITNARGLVCIPMSAALCDEIGFKAMKSDNIKADKLGTPFYQSVDLDNGSTGVSAVERSKTARHIASNNAKLKDDRYNEIISKINDIKDLIEIYNHDYGECLELTFSKTVTQFNPFDYWFPLRG